MSLSPLSTNSRCFRGRATRNFIRYPHGNSRGALRPRESFPTKNPLKQFDANAPTLDSQQTESSGHPILGLGGEAIGFVPRLRRYYGSVRLPIDVHRRLRSFDCPTRSANLAITEADGIPRSRAKCIRTWVGSLTAQGPKASCLNVAPSFTFRLCTQPRHPEVTHLVAGHGSRSTIPSLYVPLSTLHLCPHGCRCMTRDLCVGQTFTE